MRHTKLIHRPSGQQMQILNTYILPARGSPPSTAPIAKSRFTFLGWDFWTLGWAPVLWGAQRVAQGQIPLPWRRPRSYPLAVAALMKGDSSTKFFVSLCISAAMKVRISDATPQRPSTKRALETAVVDPPAMRARNASWE